MTSIGEILRRERQKQSRSVSEIANQTKISSRYLEAIEKGDLERLPGLFFYKSFVRQYSEELGLPAARLDPLLEEVARPEPDLAVTGERYPIKPLDPLVEGTNRHFSLDRRIGLSVSMLLVVAFGCSAVYAWWHQAQLERAREVVVAAVSPGAGPARPQQNATAPPAPAAVTPPAAAAAPSSEAASAAAQPTPASPAADTPAAASTAAATAGPPTGDGMRIDVSATEKTWLSIVTDGKFQFSGVLEPSQSKTLEGKQFAQLKVGNAGGVEIVWNGKSIGPLGGRGQVCTVVFTRDKYQIVPSGHPL